MGKIRVILIIAGVAMLAGIACGDDDAEPTPTTSPTPTSEPTEPPATATPTESPTSTPTQPAPTATPTTVPPPTPDDGTIDPLNPGDTSTKPVKSSIMPGEGPAVLVDVRVSLRPEIGGWDRIVLEFETDGIPPGEVGYRDSVQACGSGDPVSIPGSGASLVVELQPAVAHDDDGNLTLRSGRTDLVGPPGGATVGARQTCDFEGTVSWVFGLAGERNFKLTVADEPTRLIIDVKQ